MRPHISIGRVENKAIFAKREAAFAGHPKLLFRHSHFLRRHLPESTAQSYLASVTFLERSDLARSHKGKIRHAGHLRGARFRDEFFRHRNRGASKSIRACPPMPPSRKSGPHAGFDPEDSIPV
uniref:hypothetical protein n=1 Tax=Edaphosphingomonas laterariae TaxID=861865 RepID=UPI0011819AEE|nr:hypothetical protein [Sphingomonas laterariae]